MGCRPFGFGSTGLGVDTVFSPSINKGVHIFWFGVVNDSPRREEIAAILPDGVDQVLDIVLHLLRRASLKKRGPVFG